MFTLIYFTKSTFYGIFEYQIENKNKNNNQKMAKNTNTFSRTKMKLIESKNSP